MKKETSPKSKILRKLVIGIAVYCATFLISIILLKSFSGYLKYGDAMVSVMASLIAGAAAFFTITPDEKTTLLYNPKAVFTKKPYYIIIFILFVILTSYSLNIVFNFLFSLFPWEKLGNKNIVQDNEAFYGIPLYLRLISYVLIGPFSEEVLFRGVVFFRFRKVLPALAASFASALFFGVYHGNLMQGIYAFFMGFVMCLVMEYGGSFFYAYLFHVIANLISNLAYEFDNINNVIYSVPGIIIAAAYLVVAIILSYVFKHKLTKKDKEC